MSGTTDLLTAKDSLFLQHHLTGIELENKILSHALPQAGKELPVLNRTIFFPDTVTLDFSETALVKKQLPIFPEGAGIVRVRSGQKG